MRSLIAFLLLAVCAASAWAQSCRLSCSDRAGDSSFDYYKLVRQWPLSYCDKGCRNTPPDGVSFTLHGLWPQRLRPVDGKWWPECCNPGALFNADAVKPLLKDLEKLWPSWDQPNSCFWKHEYDKHGTCAASLIGNGTFGYFEATLRLHKQFSIEKALAKAGIQPKNGKPVDTARLLAALKAAFGRSSTITCDNGQLEEVMTCFSKNKLELIDCPTGWLQCRAEQVEIPAGRYDFTSQWGDE